MSKQNTLERPDVEIKVWMLRNDLSVADIADAYGVGAPFIRQFILGTKTSKGLERFMVEQGCPAGCFDRGRVRMAGN